MKQFFEKIWGFFYRIWMLLLGLKSSDSLKTFSPRERRVFFEDLGYIPLILFLVLWILGFFVNFFVASDTFGWLVVLSAAILMLFWIVKIICNVGPVKSWEREAEGCEFSKKERKGVIYGFVTYNNHVYGVEYFDLDENGELLNLSVKISSDEKSGKVVRVYYDEDKKTFIERTEVREGVYKSYEIVSWIFFISSLLMSLALFIGAIIIIF